MVIWTLSAMEQDQDYDKDLVGYDLAQEITPTPNTSYHIFRNFCDGNLCENINHFDLEPSFHLISDDVTRYLQLCSEYQKKIPTVKQEKLQYKKGKHRI